MKRLDNIQALVGVRSFCSAGSRWEDDTGYKDFKVCRLQAMDKHHHAQEIMKEKMPSLDPNSVSVKAKPKENSEQVLLYHVCHLVTVGLHRTFFILRIVCWTRGNELYRKGRAMFKTWCSSRPSYRASPRQRLLCWTHSTGAE